MTRTQRRAVLSVVAVLVAAPFLLAGGLAAFRAIHSPWPEPVPGVRLEPRVPFLAPGDPVPTNDAMYVLNAISNVIDGGSRMPSASGDENRRFDAGGLAAGPFPQLAGLLGVVGPAWPLWDLAAQSTVDRVREPAIERVGPCRQSILLGRLTGVRAAYAIRSNDWTNATVAWDSTLRNARHLRRYHALSEHLIGVAVAELALRSMEQALVLNEAPNAALQPMDVVLAVHDRGRCPGADSIRGELRLALSALRQIQEHPGEVSGLLKEPWACALSSAGRRRLFRMIAGSSPERTRIHIEAVYSHLIADAERPGTGDISEWLGRLSSNPGRFMFDDPVGAMLLALVLPVTDSLQRRTLDEDALLRGVRTLVAIERFRRANGGAAPESLGALVPAWLPAVPADPFDPNGGPLRYVPGRAPMLLYSVGTNGVDDTARAPDGAPSTNDMHFGRAYLDQLRAFLMNTNAADR